MVVQEGHVHNAMVRVCEARSLEAGKTKWRGKEGSECCFGLRG